jgi:hypothetical protein
MGDNHIEEASGTGTVRVAVFAKAHKIGCVSDWSKE